MDRVRLLPKSSPYVLPTEFLAELEDDRHGIRKALNPPNRIAAIYADELAQDHWLVKRLRRTMSQRVKSQLPQVLYDKLSELGEPDLGECAADLVERWSRDDPNAETEVSAILKRHGLEKGDLEGEAIARSLKELGFIDQLLTSASSRRDKALAGFAFACEVAARAANHAASRDAVRLEQPKTKVSSP